MLTQTNTEKEQKAKIKQLQNYKSFFKGTSNYFNKLEKIQKAQIEEFNKMRDSFKEDFDGQTNYTTNDVNKAKENINFDTERSGDIDLAYYEKNDNNSKQSNNIDGLKNAIKHLIRASKDRKITNILKQLSTEITSITETDGKALKSYNRNTYYKELLEKYKDQKEAFDNESKSGSEDYESEYSEKTPDKETSTQSQSPTTSDNSDFSALKNNLEILKETEYAEQNKLKLQNTSWTKYDKEFLEKIENKQLLKEEQKVQKSGAELSPEEKISSHLLKSENTDLVDNAKALADKLPSPLPSNTSVKESKENKNRTSNDGYMPLDAFLDNEKSKAEQEATAAIDEDEDEETISPIDEDEQYEYELMRTEYLNKVEPKIMVALRRINSIQMDQIDPNNKKYKTTNDISHFLLSLLRQNEQSITTSKIQTIFMTHRMYNLAEISETDLEEYYDRKNAGETTSEDEGLKKLISTIYYKDENYNERKKENKVIPDDILFARYLFRLFYIISSGDNIDPDNLNQHQPDENDDFTKAYKQLKSNFRASMVYLREQIGKKLTPDDTKNKGNDKNKNKGNDKNKALYDLMYERANFLSREEKLNIKATNAIKEIQKEYEKNYPNFNGKIGDDSNIYKDNEYFNIDKNIHWEKYNSNENF